MSDAAGADPEPGDWIRAVFPRMGGKQRPGLVAAIVRRSGRVGVIATPVTSRRTNQGGRMPAPPGPGLDRTSQLIPPMTAVLPLSAIAERLGPSQAEALPSLEEALAHWFGPSWALTPPPAAPGRGRILNALSPQARRRAARPGPPAGKTHR